MSSVILIGYGSVGRRHAEVVRNNGHQVVIVDHDKDARNHAIKTYPNATVISDIEQIDHTAQYSAGIIATWAPTHCKYFHELADLGVDRILCEKPLSHSLASAESMCSRADLEDIRLLVNHQFRYSDEVDKIRLWENDFDLGSPVRISSAGGALGLVNNGVHYKDLAFQIFGSQPTEVVSTAQSDSINPRSDSLDYYGGTTVVDFGERREAIFTYNNRSSLESSLRIDYRDGVIIINSENNVTIRHRDPDELKEYPSITRYGPASTILHSESKPFTVDVPTRFEKAMDDLFADSTPKSPGGIGKDILHACIGSLIASVENKSVNLPISTENDYWEHEWGFN